MNKPMNRRAFARHCAALAATGFALAAGRSVAEEAAQVDPESAQAKALGYVHDAAAVDTTKYGHFVAGSNCGNCQLYQGGEAWGGCGIFPGKQVNFNGWCSAWAKKAG